MHKQFYKADDLAEILGISTSKSYQIIRQLNEELQKKGYLVCRGRVPAAYVQERFYGAGKEPGNG